MRRIMILEDQIVISDWIEKLVSDIFPLALITSASTLEQALEILEPLADLFLVDLSLPDGYGYDLIRQIKQRDESKCCVVITSFEDDSYLFPALRAGADGYLLKDHSTEELQQLLLGIIDGKPPLSPIIAQRIVSYFRQSTEVHSQKQLSNREQQTLSLIAKGYSIKQSARLMSISPHTVADHVKHIYKKLHIHSRAEAALEAKRLGL